MTRTTRRKPEERTDAIIGAAMEEFATNGYAGTRLDDVAARAGISKGLVYVYFKTKEELFKAVVRALIIPQFDEAIARFEASPLPTAEVMRGPLLDFMRAVANSRLPIILRLLMAEGPRHPDLTAFYHREVVARGMALLRSILDRGVARGEIRQSAYQEFPQLFAAPMLMAVIWRALFDAHAPLDRDRFLAAHIELALSALMAPPPPPTSEAAP